MAEKSKPSTDETTQRPNNMGYDRNDPWMTCGERDDNLVDENELARFLFTVQFGGAKAWTEASPVTQRPYRKLAKNIVQKFVVVRAV